MMSTNKVLIKFICLSFLFAVFSVSASSGNDANKAVNKVEQGTEPVKDKTTVPINKKSSEVVKEIQTQPTKDNSAEPVKGENAGSVKEKWGVDNFRVRLTSAGYMLDVRYRVFDKTKAKPLFSRKLRPFAIEEASNVKYGVPASPKVGFLRQAPTHIKENKEYFLMIANPGKRLKSGDKLTLVIGDFRIEHLTIE